MSAEVAGDRHPALGEPGVAAMPFGGGSLLLAEARRLLGSYDNMAEMIRLGAYRVGSDPLVDRAIVKHPAFEAFLGQGVDERPRRDAFAALGRILGGQ